MVEAEDKLPLKEVARQLGRSLEQVRRYVREGKLPAQKLGMQWFVERRDLEAFKSSRPFGGVYPEPFDSSQGKLHRRTQGRGGAIKEDVLARAWALRERIRKRVGWFDVVELLEESRRNHPFDYAQDRPFDETEDGGSAGVYPEPFDSAQGRLQRSTEDKPFDDAQDRP